MTQSVKDAIADAETLWAGISHSALYHTEAWTYDMTVRVALARSTPYRLSLLVDEESQEDAAEQIAREAARAAFRAVPALRCCK